MSNSTTVTLDSRYDSAVASFEEARDAGGNPSTNVWIQRYPDVADRLCAYFADARKMAELTNPIAVPDAIPPTVPDYEFDREPPRIGGMGKVFKARKQSTQQTVALKTIRTDLLENLSPDNRRKTVERFITEARVAASLEHENIVKVYDVGEVDGKPYYAMRFVEGGSLSELIAHGPMEPVRAAKYIEQVARAIHVAHQHGVIHRDLKPNNILVDSSSDKPLVVDFGLAKLMDENQDLTRTREILGTPPYLSPEQATNSLLVTTATDVYGLGATLYSLLTGRPPFQADTTFETLKKVVDEEPTRPQKLKPDVPRDLETICLKCLRKDPHKRYASAEALAKDLRSFQEGCPIDGRPTPPWERAWMWMKRKPLVASLYAALGVVVLLAVGIGMFQWRETVSALEDAQRKLYALRVNNAAGLLADGFSDLAEDELERCPVQLRDWEWHHLKRWCRGNVTPLPTNGRAIKAYAVNADGSLLLTGDDRGEVRLWGGNQFQKSVILVQHQGADWSVNSVCCQGDIWSVAFKADATVKVFKINSLEKWTTLDCGVKGERFAISPNGRNLASAERDGTLWIQDLRARAAQPMRLKDKHSTTSLAFSPDSRFLVTAGHGVTRKIRFWDAITGDEVEKKIPEHDLKHIWAIAFSPDAEWFAFSDGTSLGLCHWGSLEDAKFDKVVRLHGGFKGAFQSIAFSDDNKYLLAATNNGSVTIWNMASKTIAFNARRHDGMILTAAFVPEFKSNGGAPFPKSLVYLRGNEVVFEHWKDRPVHELRLPLDKKNPVRLVTFDAKNARAALACADGKVLSLNLSGDPAPKDLGNPKGSLAVMAVSGDGQRLVGVADDCSIYVWDMANGKLAPIIPGAVGKTPPSKVACDHLGEQLAFVSDDGTVEVWDLQTKTKTLSLKEPAPVTCVAFSASGRHVAFGTDSGLIMVWDIKSRTEIARQMGNGTAHVNAVLCLAFSPDPNDEQLVSGGWDGTVKLWNFRTGSLVHTFEGHGAMITSVCFSANGRRIASAAGPVVRLFDTLHKHQEITLHDQKSAVTGICFCGRDGTSLASVTDNGVIRIWNGAPLKADSR